LCNKGLKYLMEREIIKETKIWKAKVKVHEKVGGPFSYNKKGREKKNQATKDQGSHVEQGNGEI
jgi:hypothetical protein